MLFQQRHRSLHEPYESGMSQGSAVGIPGVSIRGIIYFPHFNRFAVHKRAH
jgi:hypothetical protein